MKEGDESQMEKGPGGGKSWKKKSPFKRSSAAAEKAAAGGGALEAKAEDGSAPAPAPTEKSSDGEGGQGSPGANRLGKPSALRKLKNLVSPKDKGDGLSKKLGQGSFSNYGDGDATTVASAVMSKFRGVRGSFGPSRGDGGGGASRGDDDRSQGGKSGTPLERTGQSSVYVEPHHLDGFCRRVDSYDGQIIVVDGRATYEVGNYLGGGVAGVVYEGTPLLSLGEYPVRTGVADSLLLAAEGGLQGVTVGDRSHSEGRGAGAGADPQHVDQERPAVTVDHEVVESSGGMCDPFCGETRGEEEHDGPSEELPGRERSAASLEYAGAHAEMHPPQKAAVCDDANMAIEVPRSRTGFNKAGTEIPVLDAIDAPSRSEHYTRKARQELELEQQRAEKGDGDGLAGLTISAGDRKRSDPLFLAMEQTVAVKILNPVGYRLLSADSIKDAVVVKEGEPFDPAVVSGHRPMEEKNVWWLINPNSRNLRTLKKTGPAGDVVDRGSEQRGLRLSLVAAYLDPGRGVIKELPLTRCIEIWGHAPFGATEDDFEAMMDSIERVNAGQPPSKYGKGTNMPAADEAATDLSGSIGGGYLSPVQVRRNLFSTTEVEGGLARAMEATRKTVYCSPLSAYIAVPAVPPKYLRWLRQRRAATKEIRHMMQIGRHRNVVHLYEVLELIQDSKSTMFLILELVRGGELFDLISSSSGAKDKGNGDDGEEDPEVRMLKFFSELAAGIAYCHENGIAHRDLKPENLLVHNGPEGQTLKIADFGLSATFHFSGLTQGIASVDPDLLSEGGSIVASPTKSTAGVASPTPSPYSLRNMGATALLYLTCGNMDNVFGLEGNGSPEPLKRMTSIVGSPHYVAPEIISQDQDKKKKSKNASRAPDQVANTGGVNGYDGTKADVWSAGIILYAMLFRSLPFGEDLLRCPRYLSFSKWYDEARRKHGRRSLGAYALDPNYTQKDEDEMLGPHWFFPATTSRESRDLIVAMLNSDARERLSIEQVLRHPWTTGQRTDP